MVRGEIATILLGILAWSQYNHCSASGAFDSTECHCRKTVVWGGQCSENCSKVYEWTPRSRWWKDHLYSHNVPWGNETGIAQRCFEISFGSPPELGSSVEPEMSFNVSTQRIAVVLNAFSETDAAAVAKLANCVKEAGEETFFEQRQFQGGNEDGGFNGNDCTYMAPFLSLVTPGLAARIVDIAEKARQRTDWGLEHPRVRSLGIRTAEHLFYRGGGSLAMHGDMDSVFTVVIALSDPSDYEGGQFVFEIDPDSGELQKFKLPKLSAVVFHSESNHMILPITGGTRQALAVEFWDAEDITFGHRRPSMEVWNKWERKQMEHARAPPPAVAKENVMEDEL